MKSSLGVCAFASALAFASTPCHALSFNFSITNTLGNVSGTVAGLIEGIGFLADLYGGGPYWTCRKSNEAPHPFQTHH
jgi:hypothetical protein